MSIDANDYPCPHGHKWCNGEGASFALGVCSDCFRMDNDGNPLQREERPEILTRDCGECRGSGRVYRCECIGPCAHAEDCSACEGNGFVELFCAACGDHARHDTARGLLCDECATKAKVCVETPAFGAQS